MAAQPPVLLRHAVDLRPCDGAGPADLAAQPLAARAALDRCFLRMSPGLHDSGWPAPSLLLQLRYRMAAACAQSAGHRLMVPASLFAEAGWEPPPRARHADSGDRQHHLHLARWRTHHGRLEQSGVRSEEHTSE